MSDINIGELADKDAQRDATHVACAPMLANDLLNPGAHVGVISDGIAGKTNKTIGIVDPFLAVPVKQGERFWLFLYPRTVTGLRHQYIHPALDGEGIKTSKDWIEKWASSQGIGYTELMNHAEDWAASGGWGEYWCEGGRFEGISFPAEEFWHHYDIVTGTKTPQDKREYFFYLLLLKERHLR